MNVNRKLLPPLALVGALALIPSPTSSLAAADIDQLRRAREVHERLQAGQGQLCRQGRRPDADQGRDRRHAGRARPAFSSYVEASRLREAAGRTTDGNYGGLGLTVSIEDGAVKVIAPTEDTPAWRAGIKAGDYITHLNGELIYGCTLDEAVEKMRGAPGTDDQADASSGPGRDKPFDVALVRESIELRPVKWEVKDGIGIININTFTGNTGDADQGGAGRDRQGDRRQAARLCRRPALEPRRAARPGDRGQRRVPRAVARSSRSAAATRATSSAIMRKPGRHGARPADHRAGRCRHRFGVRDRRRRAAGSSPRAGHGRAQLRQGIGPDRRPDQGRQRALRLTTARYYTPSGRRCRKAGSTPTSPCRSCRDPDYKERPGGPRGRSAPPFDQPGQGRRHAARGRTTPPIRASPPPPRSSKKKGVKDFQLDYALKTIKRLAGPRHRVAAAIASKAQALTRAMSQARRCPSEPASLRRLRRGRAGAADRAAAARGAARRGARLAISRRAGTRARCATGSAGRTVRRSLLAALRLHRARALRAGRAR